MAWISVKDRMPELPDGPRHYPAAALTDDVLVAADLEIEIAAYDLTARRWWIAYTYDARQSVGQWLDDVTHWQPLPKHPTEEA